jgi:hypothetical protein
VGGGLRDIAPVHARAPFVCRGCEMQQMRLRLLPKLSLFFSELLACVSDLGGDSDRFTFVLGS